MRDRESGAYGEADSAEMSGGIRSPYEVTPTTDSRWIAIAWILVEG
jgi:hypothetical protein